MFVRINLFVILSLLIVSCSPRATGCLATEQQSAIKIYIVQHGWHSGIVVPSAEIKQEFSILTGLAADYKFIEIGWGDKEFYLRDGGGFWIGLKAALLPTSSVLHLVRMNHHPEHYFPVSGVHSLHFNRAAFINLLEFIESSFVVKESEVIWLAQPLYGSGGFYAAENTFHLFNNCNTWVADALGHSGCRLSHIQSLTSGGLSSQLEQLGRQELSETKDPEEL